MKKSWIVAGSLTVIAAVAIAVPAVRGLAIEGRAERKAQDCAAQASELTTAVTDLQGALAAVPPKLDGVDPLVNGLLGQVTGLIDTGCLPKPELPAAAAQPGTEQLVPLPTVVPVPSGLPVPSGVPLPSNLPTPSGLPLPSVSALPPVRDALPTVPVCTDLTADLLDAVAGVLKAVLSTNLPDLTGATSALAELLDTLTKLTDAANNCLPTPPAAAKR